MLYLSHMLDSDATDKLETDKTEARARFFGDKETVTETDRQNGRQLPKILHFQNVILHYNTYR